VLASVEDELQHAGRVLRQGSIGEPHDPVPVARSDREEKGVDWKITSYVSGVALSESLRARTDR